VGAIVHRAHIYCPSSSGRDVAIERIFVLRDPSNWSKPFDSGEQHTLIVTEHDQNWLFSFVLDTIQGANHHSGFIWFEPPNIVVNSEENGIDNRSTVFAV
jgi:hypothetical protein